MARTRRIGLTFLQVLTGCFCGVVAGGTALLLVNLVWQGLQRVHSGGFIMSLLLLISFLLVFGVAVAATAEGVRQMGRLFMPRESSRRRIYEWTFLGICAAVAILTVTRADWISTLQEWGNPVRSVGTLVYYIIVRPVYFVIFWIPPLLVLLLAAPIGAVIAYNLPPPEEEVSEPEDAEEPSKDKERRRKK